MTSETGVIPQARRTRVTGTWEQHHLEVPLQATHHPDLEIHRRSFTVTASKSWKSLLNSTVDAPTPHGLQRFKGGSPPSSQGQLRVGNKHWPSQRRPHPANEFLKMTNLLFQTHLPNGPGNEVEHCHQSTQHFLASLCNFLPSKVVLVISAQLGASLSVYSSQSSPSKAALSPLMRLGY